MFPLWFSIKGKLARGQAASFKTNSGRRPG
jgi:hypothetical protein